MNASEILRAQWERDQLFVPVPWDREEEMRVHLRGHGIALMRRYLEDQVNAGVLAIEDCEVAAAQFIDSCQSTLFKPLIFNFGEPPTDERIRHVVGIAVRTFLAAYRVP